MRSIILLILICPLFSYSQPSLENVDTSRSALLNIDTLRSCALVRSILNDLLNHGNADSIASKCDIPITIEEITYSNTKDLSAFFAKVIQAGDAKKFKIEIGKATVVGRRQEVLNGFVKIDILYIQGVIRFDINGQHPEKYSLFAIRNANDPRVIGMFMD